MSASSANGRNLVPDNALLNHIFPRSPLASTVILSQTFEVCTFVAHLDATSPTDPHPVNVIVRLELPSKSPLRIVSALQQVATLAIPEAVPAVFQTGTAKAEDGREVEFFVSAYVDNAVTLETVWDDLTYHQQSDIMDAVLYAMTKLQKLDLAHEFVQQILKKADGGSGVFFKTTGEEGGVWPSNPNNLALGNREIGFFNDVPDLLTSIIGYNGVSEKLRLSPSRSEPSDDSNGIVMASTDEETPLVLLHIGSKELDSLQRQVVLCHNDLEPRNLLVRPVHVVGDDGSSVQRYDLAAIIDWEMAGFFPFAYEYAIKDGLLGLSNLSFSWYSLFKRRTAPLLPTELAQPSSYKSQILFIEAMDRIQRSEEQKQGRNVGTLFRERWFWREQLVPGPLLVSGWVRRPDASDVRAYRKADNELLEQEVLKELGLL